MADDMTGLFNDLVNGLDKCTTALQDAAAAFNGTPSRSGRPSSSSSSSPRVRSSGSNLNEALRDAEKMFARNSKNNKDALNMEQKIGKTFLVALKEVGNFFIKEFTSSIKRVSDSYLSNLTSITSRMQLSNEQYAGLYNTYASKISREFKGAFSVKDFSNSLVTALDMGLRGKTAEDVAYRNMITNKLAPAIATNTQAYRRMSTTLGDSFNKNITAMAKYADSINAAVGIEEGKLNANIDTFEKEYMYKAAKEGLSKDEAATSFAQYQYALAQTTATFGEETTSFIMNELKNNMNGQIGSGSLFSAAFGKNFTPEQAYKAMMENPTEVISRYISVLSDQAKNLNEDALSVYGETGLTDLDALHQVGAQTMFGETTPEDFSKMLSENTSKLNEKTLKQIYNQETENLEKGYYISADDYFSNQLDNITTWFAAWKSNRARFDELLGIVKNIGLTAASMFLFTKTKGALQGLSGSSGGSGGLFNFLGNAGSASGGQTGLFGRLASRGYSMAPSEGVSGLDAAAKGLTGTSTATAAGVGVGLGGMVIGGYRMLKSGISTGIQNKSLGAGLVATFAGDSYLGLSESEKLSKAQDDVENGWVGKSGIDWKKVGKNALTGTAVGAGVGTAVGGWALGSGTAIGAGIGAIAGAATSVIQQISDSVYYKQLAKASKEYKESLDKLNETSQQYEVTKEKEISLTEIINKDHEDLTQKDLSALKTAYPDLLENVESLTELDKSYVNIVREKIKLEAKDSADALVSGARDTLKKGKKVFDKTTKKSVGKMATEVGEAEKVLAEEMHTSGSVSQERINEVAKQFGMSGDTLSSYVKDWAQYDKKTGEYTFFNEAAYQNIISDYKSHSSTKDITQSVEDINKGLSDLKNSSNRLKSLWIYNEDTKAFEYQGSNEDDFKSLFEEYNSYGEDIKHKINKTKGDANKALLTSWKKIRPDLFGINKKITPKDYLNQVGFKTGSYNIGRDMTAKLHAGEMVLTSANADMVRALSSEGGVSGLIKGLYGLSQANVSAVDTTTSVSPITTAIAEQTSALSDLLSKILDAVTVIGQNKNPTISNPVTVNTDLFTYEGG